MNVEPTEEKTPVPAHGRWQFSLRQMFVATTGVAVVFSLAAWGGWVQSDAVVYLASVAFASAFSRAARQVLVGACIILAALWPTGFLTHIACSPYWGSGVFAMPLWIAVPIIFYFATFLRANCYATVWSLIGSLILAELLIVALIVHSCGYSTLIQALGRESQQYWLPRELTLPGRFSSLFPKQAWYVAVPWLIGTLLGEVVARRRKSGST
jgi:hypothetical protein